MVDADAIPELCQLVTEGLVERHVKYPGRPKRELTSLELTSLELGQHAQRRILLHRHCLLGRPRIGSFRQTWNNGQRR